MREGMGLCTPIKPYIFSKFANPTTANHSIFSTAATTDVLPKDVADHDVSLFFLPLLRNNGRALRAPLYCSPSLGKSG